jgi:hypothetical protein
MPQQLPARLGPASMAATAPRRRAGRLAWALLGLIIVLMAANLVLAFTGGETGNAKIATMPVALAFALVGALIAARTGNRLGWLFLAAGLAAGASLVADAYAARTATAQLPGAAWAAWIFTVILGIVATLFFLTPLQASLLVLLAGVVAIIVRFRRSDTEQRLQLKWFMYATAVAAVAVFAAGFGHNPLLEFEIFFPLIPAAVGIAILKYRLYDIDRLISRTLAYAIVTGLLIGVYAGLVLLATQVFSSAPRWRSPRPRSRRQRCSARCAGGCSAWWTAIQPGPLRRRPDRGRLRGRAPGRRGPRHCAGRPACGREPGRGARASVRVDRHQRPAIVRS